MREVLRLGFVLLIVCAVAGAALALVDGVTRDRIAAQATIRLQQALKDVLPKAEEFQDKQETLFSLKAKASESDGPMFPTVNQMYAGYFQGKSEGFVFICSPIGYGGAIETAVGVSSDGIVKGVSVIRHSETPGLGANIATKRFQDAFIGIPSDVEVRVKENGGQIDAITGATISSEAVASAVNESLKIFGLINNEGAAENEF